MAYLNYKVKYEPKSKSLDIFQKENRLNARIGYKKDISQLLNEASTNDEVKKHFLGEIKKTKSFVKKVKILLIESDLKTDFSIHLKSALDKLFNPHERNNFRRTIQDFYILWYVVNPISLEILKLNRREIALALSEIIEYSKNIPEEMIEQNFPVLIIE